MHSIDIYRGNLFLYTIKPDSDSVQVKKIMGENEVRVNCLLNQFVDFRVGDRANIFGEAYYLNIVPQVTKTASNNYGYQMILQSTKDTLAKVQYMFLGDDNSLKESVFSLTGTATDFMKLLIRNMERLLPLFSFSAGVVLPTDYKTLSFDTDDCLSALSKIAEAFNTEWWVEGTVITLQEISRDLGLTFKHGKRKGLYELVRQTVDNSNVVTRLYAFGSDKNLPENYRNFSKRLKLPAQPGKTVTNLTWTIVDNHDGTFTITFDFTPPSVPGLAALTIKSRPLGSADNFANASTGSPNPTRTYTVGPGDWEFIFRTELTGGPGETSMPVAVVATTVQPALAQNGDIIAVEKNIDQYGVSERTAIFEDIYPHRTGTVSSVDAGNFYRFHDVAIDFNVNDYLLPGMAAKVTFNTGQLSGYTFDISEYDNTAKRFTILKNRNERVLEVPSFDLKPAIGDLYVLTDIKMPPSYIAAAEALLLQEAKKLLDKESEPQLAYQLIFDPVYLKERHYDLGIGDMIWIVDEAMMIQRRMRIVSMQRNIIDEFNLTLEIADVIASSKISNLVSGQGALNTSVNALNSNLQNNSILNNRVVGDLIMTGQSSIKFDDLQTGSGLTPIGIDANGRIWKI